MRPAARPSSPQEEEEPEAAAEGSEAHSRSHAHSPGAAVFARAPLSPRAAMHDDVEAEIADLQRKKIKMERKYVLARSTVSVHSSAHAAQAARPAY